MTPYIWHIVLNVVVELVGSNFMVVTLKNNKFTFLPNVANYLYFNLYDVTCQNTVVLILITARTSFLSPTEMLCL